MMLVVTGDDGNQRWFSFKGGIDVPATRIIWPSGSDLAVLPQDIAAGAIRLGYCRWLAHEEVAEFNRLVDEMNDAESVTAAILSTQQTIEPGAANPLDPAPGASLDPGNMAPAPGEAPPPDAATAPAAVVISPEPAAAASGLDNGVSGADGTTPAAKTPEELLAEQAASIVPKKPKQT